jgi:lipid-A-disaccharide synthase
MGLVEVLRELPRIRSIMGALVEAARERRPQLAVLVDSPDFNLRLAKHLAMLDIPVLLFISPQLWAWRRGRVKQVRRLAEEVLCILPFEVDFYHQAGVKARYVGHPLVDEVARQGLLDAVAERGTRRLALLPGSRQMEVRSLLPVMLRAVRQLPPSLLDEVVLIEAPGVERSLDEVLTTETADRRLRRVAGDRRRHELAGASLAWTASGTATLECALLDVPMVVGYRLKGLKGLSYAIAKLLVSVDHVALVNLIAGRRLAPELIQHDWNVAQLVGTSLRLLEEQSASQRAGLASVRRALGRPGASRVAAAAVKEYLQP